MSSLPSGRVVDTQSQHLDLFRSDATTLRRGARSLLRGVSLASAINRWARAAPELLEQLRLPLPDAHLPHVARAVALLKVPPAHSTLLASRSLRVQHDEGAIAAKVCCRMRHACAYSAVPHKRSVMRGAFSAWCDVLCVASEHGGDLSEARRRRGCCAAAHGRCRPDASCSAGS
jgi:hypothetical protein